MPLIGVEWCRILALRQQLHSHIPGLGVRAERGKLRTVKVVRASDNEAIVPEETRSLSLIHLSHVSNVVSLACGGDFYISTYVCISALSSRKIFRSSQLASITKHDQMSRN